MQKRPRFLLRVLCAAIFFASTIHWLLRPIPAAQTAAPKYIFLFLADGGGIPHMEITRQYNRLIHNEGLVITDKIIKEGVLGLMTTHAADSLVTESAAAATAMASGCKAKFGALGICADGTTPKTTMEIAKGQGMRIGFVTTAAVYDASPAAFVSHLRTRRDYAAIIDGYLQFEPEVLFGGGRDQFLAHGEPGSRRKDGRNIIQAFRDKGYGYAATKEHLAQLKGRKALGLFTLEDMSFEIDRDDKVEPSLPDMTRAAIRLLHDDDPRGFFVFIENENIDTAGHLTDIAALIRDYREFDRAVSLAYEFYRKYPRETLIIVTSDHETGGLGFTLALKDLRSIKGGNRVAATVDDLKKIQSVSLSLRKAAAMLGPHPTATALDKLMTDYFPGFSLAPDIRDAIIGQQPLSRTLYLDHTANALGMMVANNTQAYWQTSTHTNHPVFVAALGFGAERFRGYLDNADFGKTLKALLESNQTR